MNFIYRVKRFKFEKEFKLYLEKEFSDLSYKYFFISESDKVHINVEILSGLKIHLKIEIFIFKIGKKIASSDISENIFNSINETKRKTDIQLLKIKEKIKF